MHELEFKECEKLALAGVYTYVVLNQGPVR
jgi:hypothetical protein